MTRSQRGLDGLFGQAVPTRFMYYLGKYLPPFLGNIVVFVITRSIIATKPSIYSAATHNLAHVLPEDTSEADLTRSVHRLIHNSVRGHYWTFHNLGWGRTDPLRMYPPVVISPEAMAHFEHASRSGRGLLVLGTHTSNFDLCGVGLSHYLPTPSQALSIADPLPGYEFFNRLRERGRGVVTPISPASLRDALGRLRQGGIVMTAVDRPLVQGNEPVTFFGETAYLPTGYARIPLKTNCLVIVTGFRYEDEHYHILASEPMEFIRSGDRETDIRTNVRRVLAQVEDFIRQAPEQWMMFVPVWRDEAEEN